MGVYTRFKRSPEGFRQLVELWETTPMERRKRMIEVGMAEDKYFTERALQFVMTFHDVIALPDLELAELLATAPPRSTAFAIKELGDDVKERFFRNARPQVCAEIRDFMNMQIGTREIGGAQLKMVEKARELERRGLIKTKRIPI